MNMSSTSKTLCSSTAISPTVLQDLRKENAALLKDLSEIRSLHEQLIHEGTSENISQRRVNLLKSQIFQLERQVALLSDTVSGYAGAYTELFSMLETMGNQLSSGNHSPDEFLKMIRQMQNRLSKSKKESSPLPLLFMRGFSTPLNHHEKATSSKKPANVMDVCLGGTDHINLKQVGQLESKLAKLFGELVQVRSSLQATPTSQSLLLQPMNDHCESRVASCCEVVSECCHDLLCLSLLVPTIPWSNTSVPVPLELNSNQIMKRMPPAMKNKKEVREIIERTCNFFFYLNDMNSTKSGALEKELEFHKSVYTLQVSYVESLMEAMRNGYKKFENSLQELICVPLKNLLSGLSSTASNTTLGEFSKQVQVNVEQLKSAVESLSCPYEDQEQPQGSKALSEFGTNFFKSLLKLEKECAAKRSEHLQTLNQPNLCSPVIKL